MADAYNQHKCLAMGHGLQSPPAKGKGPANMYKKGGQVKAPAASSYKKGGLPRKGSSRSY
jgi:hypothetical protein